VHSNFTMKKNFYVFANVRNLNDVCKFFWERYMRACQNKRLSILRHGLHGLTRFFVYIHRLFIRDELLSEAKKSV
jgi:hypothetical protein